MHPRNCSFALLALGAVACADTPRSCDLATSALVLQATISDLDDGVEVEIELETAGDAGSAGGPGTTLALCHDADHLEVNGVRAEELYALGHRYYVVQFDQSESSFEISLQRNDGTDVSATVQMPPALEITAPSDGTARPRGEPLEVSWTPNWTGHQLNLAIEDEIGSSCIEGLGYEAEVDDTGSFIVAANELVGGGAISSCEVTLTLTRALEAEYPAALAPGGSISAIVKRRRVFTSVQ
ncbi:hypothetical protein DB30_01112 [Enhygromyxa salina]|uniref:Lipoprotein n=1 Tax=Enhygromyxa salina TaxID=215803 RepID=A0A0C1Z570_9BACT|nr:hypothetical protein [Enhygromyxa salina]KIG12754.1 hypothetical protein DB30_01112 [Enhygromyxa salina]